MFKPNQKVKLTCSVEQFIEEAYHGLYTYKENFDLYGMATVEKFERGYLFLKGKGDNTAILTPKEIYLVEVCNRFSNTGERKCL